MTSDSTLSRAALGLVLMACTTAAPCPNPEPVRREAWRPLVATIELVRPTICARRAVLLFTIRNVSPSVQTIHYRGGLRASSSQGEVPSRHVESCVHCEEEPVRLRPGATWFRAVELEDLAIAARPLWISVEVSVGLNHPDDVLRLQACELFELTQAGDCFSASPKPTLSDAAWVMDIGLAEDCS